MAILVTGGAGYIGSHTVVELLENNEEVIVVDNLSKGHLGALRDGVKFYQGDICDKSFLSRVFDENDIDGVIHFAALSLVGESVIDPFTYYDNNVLGTLNLLKVMKEYDVNTIVFSSTAAVYGEPQSFPVLETDYCRPNNPYGDSKLSVERMIFWAEKAYGIKYIILRYFNAAGAHISGELGEDHNPESHLIPLTLQVALGKRDNIKIFGADYATLDGTCIRDYVHVSDLAKAHILAILKLRQGGESCIYNLGNGEGFSVKEVIDVAREVTGHPIPSVIENRRAGDPGILVASSVKICNELGWKPKFNTLKQIVESAWNWHNNNPDGFSK